MSGCEEKPERGWTFVRRRSIRPCLIECSGSLAVVVGVLEEFARNVSVRFFLAYLINPLPETAWLLGDAREMLGDSVGAHAEYERVIQTGKRSDRLTLALFYATKDREHEEALRLIEAERGVRGGIYIDDTYAWALYRAGRIAEARRASDQALRLGTRDARLLYHAGAIWIATGDPIGRQLVQKALALNPKFDLTGATEATKLLNSHGKNSRKP